MSILWLVVSTLLPTAFALDNGLALTPPMGWFTWKRFKCITKCATFPGECISENLIKRQADRMVRDGYLAAGYNYVGIDDCWMEWNREFGRMVPDKRRFPSGMKALSEYLHSRGLKFAMYQNLGNSTCMGTYPGLLDHEKLDVETFVDWEIDYLKLSSCHSRVDNLKEAFSNVGKMLNESGRSIVYSCGWPVNLETRNEHPNYTALAEHCNLWRNYKGIEHSWSSMTDIMQWFGDNQERFAPFAGPGHWNDPDMLLIGNFGVSVEHARVQMAVWSVMAAPLIMSTNLVNIRPEFKEILLNKDIIAVDQDPLGKQGLRIIDDYTLAVWKRELVNGSYAMAFVNKQRTGLPYVAALTLSMMKLPKQDYDIQDLYKYEKDQHLKRKQHFIVEVNPGGVKFYKFIPRKSQKITEINLTMIVNNTSNNTFKFTPKEAQEIAENNATMIVNNTLNDTSKLTPKNAQEIAENNATMIVNNTLNNTSKFTPKEAQETAENNATMIVNNTPLYCENQLFDKNDEMKCRFYKVKDVENDLYKKIILLFLYFIRTLINLGVTLEFEKLCPLCKI